MERERSGGFLPPKAPGPEPELGGAPPPPPAPQAPPAPPPFGYAPAAREPDNGPAVAGFVLSLVAGCLLLLTGGLSSIFSIGCAIVGLVYSRKGKRKVQSGETGKNAGLAQAGFVIGIVSLALAVIATAIWVLILVLALVDDDFQRDLDRQLDDPQTIRASLRVGAIALRSGAHLLG
jgi:hypothetical protein